MSLIATLLGTKQKVQFIQGSTGAIVNVDCSVQETHKRDSPPTEFPVETGETISDHIIVKPFELEIHGIISDTPLGLTQLIQGGVTTAVASILPPVGIITAGAGSALFKALSGSKSPSVAAFLQLLQLQESRQPFDVLTSLQRYSDMWIKSLSVPRDANTGQILFFQLSLVQLLLVSPQTVNIQILKDPGLSGGLADAGKQQPTSKALQSFQKNEAIGLGLTQ